MPCQASLCLLDTDACLQDYAHTTIHVSCPSGSIPTHGMELIISPYGAGTKILSPIPAIATQKWVSRVRARKTQCHESPCPGTQRFPCGSSDSNGTWGTEPCGMLKTQVTPQGPLALQHGPSPSSHLVITAVSWCLQLCK